MGDDIGILVAPKVSDDSPVDEKYSFNETEPLASYLGVDNAEFQDKLAEIAGFIRGDKKEFTDIDLLNEIRHIETRLGAPDIGQKRIDQVYRYVRIQRQIDGLTKDRDSLLR